MMPDDVDQLLEDLLADELEESPVLASSLGAEGYDDRLGDYTEAGFERRRRKDLAWLERFEALDDGNATAGPQGLTLDQQLDRDLVRSTLQGRRVLHDWEGWRRNPDTYLGPGLQGVFTLFLHRLRPDRELAAAAASRLRQVPDVLDAGRRNLDPNLASPLLVTRALGQARAAITYSRDLLPSEVAEEDGRAELAEAGEVAAQAYEGFASHLEDLATRATGDHAIGADRYSRILRERELLDTDSTGLRRTGQAQYDQLAAEMSDLTERIEGTGNRDWLQLVQRLNADHPETPDDMRAAYAAATQHARRFLAEHDLVTFPEGEVCDVEPSPHFQRPVLAVASYSMPPAFRPSLHGHFFVPYPPDGTPPEEVQKRLESNNRHEIPTVSVHEAYPGHHWHLVVAKANPRRIRAIYRSTYFVEGWALYAERMMREQGFFTEPTHELMHLKDRLFRAARIVVDTSLHAGEMSPDEAIDFMQRKAGLPEPTARAEVLRYCAWPTQASSYLTGSLAIERIRDRWSGSLKQFHDRIAGLGCMPPALHERGMVSEASAS